MLLALWVSPVVLALLAGNSGPVCRNLVHYVLYSIPYILQMPMYISLLPAYACARMDDFSW